MLTFSLLIFCRSANHTGPKSFQHVDFLAAHFLRQSNDNLVTLDSTHKCEADSGVAGGWLDQCVAGLDASTGLGIFDHTFANPILHRATCVEKFALGKDLTRDVVLRWDLMKANQRGVAYGVQRGVKIFGRAR